MTPVILIAAVVIALGWWRLSLWLYPHAKCHVCGGSKQTPGSNADRWGPCLKCGGTGKRLRLGARER